MRRKCRTFHHWCVSTFQMLGTEFCFLSLGFSVRTLHYNHNPLCYLVGILCFFPCHFLVCSFQVGSSFLFCKRPYRLCTWGLPLIQALNLQIRVQWSLQQTVLTDLWPLLQVKGNILISCWVTAPIQRGDKVTAESKCLIRRVPLLLLLLSNYKLL